MSGLIDAAPESRISPRADTAASASEKGSKLSQIERCLLMYPFVQTLGPFSGSSALLSLAKASKTCWNMLRRDKKIWTKLLERSQCGSDGIFKRIKVIEKYLSQRYDPEDFAERSPDVDHWDEVLLKSCGSSTTWTITRPCERCKFKVCDECRPHFLYATFLETLNLVGKEPVKFNTCITSLPHILNMEPPKSQRIIRLASMCQHDDPAIEEVIHIEIDRSLFNYKSHYSALQKLAASRERYLCLSCGRGDRAFLNAATLRLRHKYLYQPVIDSQCECTLRQRFMDRWMCLPCVQEEVEQDLVRMQDSRDSLTPTTFKSQVICGCGDLPRVFCAWCGAHTSSPDYEILYWRALNSDQGSSEPRRRLI